MDNIFYIIIFFIIFEFVVLTFLDYLNTLNWSNTLPEELVGIYDAEKYAKSMDYEKTKFRFSTLTSVFNFVLILVFLLSGLFGRLYMFLDTGKFSSNEIILTLLFFGILYLGQSIINLPFSYYSTFVIEEKFGFNKMTKKLFFIDFIKSTLITFVIGGILLALITWFYITTQEYFWLWASILLISFSVFFMLFYSTLIVPLFNKQTPLEDGELKDAINSFASKVGFTIDNIFVIDGSKRSSKANAYFAGFGPKKRIVLYDTLIQDMTTNEIVAVLAHEIGHYKKKHTLQMLFFSIFQTFLMFYLLGLILANPAFSYALGSDKGSFALGILVFSILFTPISMLLSILANILSRKNEYEADNFANTHGLGQELKSALIKLSRNNLSNLRPHPAYEFFHYSHPIVLKRIKAIDEGVNN